MLCSSPDSKLYVEIVRKSGGGKMFSLTMLIKLGSSSPIRILAMQLVEGTEVRVDNTTVK